jgi:hypothetical protein
VYIYVCIYIYVHVYIYVCIYVYVHVYIYVYVCIYMYVYSGTLSLSITLYAEFHLLSRTWGSGFQFIYHFNAFKLIRGAKAGSERLTCTLKSGSEKNFRHKQKEENCNIVEHNLFNSSNTRREDRMY